MPDFRLLDFSKTLNLIIVKVWIRKIGLITEFIFYLKILGEN